MEKLIIMSNNFFAFGNTPLVDYEYEGRKIFIKLESCNPSGSMKDRAAIHTLTKAYISGLINDETTIIESSSGNFGIALATVCKKMKLRFICVIDANTNSATEKLLKMYGTEIIKISEPDEYGGYLLNRLAKVREIVAQGENIYWINQYENKLNAEAYYSLADEILFELNHPDYIFVPVSSGGTITGVSRRIKEKEPHAKIIAVDSMGSVIFGGQAKKRYIPGLGSGIVPPILKLSTIDDVLVVEEKNMIRECREFFNGNSLLIGGSSGACLFAVKMYCQLNNVPVNSKTVTMFPDKGERYIDTIYDDNWCHKNSMI
jgi:cysteine synthase A